MSTSILGGNVKRVEDPRFIRGEGRYIDDFDIPDLLHLSSVRSLFPHGVLNGISVEDALAVPGVVAVYTAADIADLNAIPAWGGVGSHADRPVLAKDRVRFVGEAVAVVVAESALAAADAVDRVHVDIDPLPVVTTVEAAVAEGAPLLFPEVGTNVMKEEGVEDPDPDLFADADVVVSGRFVNQRIAGMPIETNCALAIPEADGRIRLWTGTQNIFNHRRVIAGALGVEPEEIHGLVTDMGGGFGPKIYIYPEQVLVAALARRLGRPVKWVERRTENLLAMVHGRGQVQHVTIGAKADGTLTALRAQVDQDMGAYAANATFLPSHTRRMASGVYRIPRIEFSFRVIATNTMSLHAYRGAGRPEAAALVERAIDLLASELEMDPVELRRKNFYRKDEFPLTTPTDAHYDTGDYEAALDLALERSGYDDLRKEQQRRRDAGERCQLGIGLSTYVEVTAGIGPHEWGAVEVHEDDTVTVRTGTSGHGQGHETAFAQLAARLLKIPHTRVRVVCGDTDLIPRGNGTGGSRSLQLGGSAIHLAGEEVVEKARRLVAHLREASFDDVVVMDGGRVGVAGVPDSALSWGELVVAAREATLPEGLDPELAAEHFFDQGAATYPFGAHVSVVEVDTETGEVSVLRHVAIDDAGNIFNRILMDGQVHGGIASGIGQALLEEVRYDEDGNPLTANLVSYILPLAPNVPSFEVDHTVTPTHLNPLGVKGVGEAATIGSTPAVQNAVIDALRPYGVTHLDMPVTAQRVWAAIHAG